MRMALMENKQMKQILYKEKGVSQCAKILYALAAKEGEWVEMPDLWRASGAFAVHSRIADLRKRGLKITQESIWKEGIVHSRYKLEVA